METKYYRLLKDSPAYKAGAIMKVDDNDSKHCSPVSDLWDSESMVMAKSLGYKPFGLATGVIENAPEWYERVYEMSWLGKQTFLTADKAREAFAKVFKEAK